MLALIASCVIRPSDLPPQKCVGLKTFDLIPPTPKEREREGNRGRKKCENILIELKVDNFFR